MTEYRKLVEIKECQRCKSVERLEVHHINKNNWDNRKENLIVLCIFCHRGLHYNHWKLEDIGIQTPENSYNLLKQEYYNVSLSHIQRELSKIDDTITLIV